MAVICYLSGSSIVPFSDALSDETYIEHNQDGNDVLVFFVEPTNSVYKQIHEETVVQFGDNNYVVKKIQDDKFEASVDLDFLKTTYHAGKYSTGTKTLEQQLRSMLGNTWTIDFTDGSTYGNAVIEVEDGTNYDIMQACMNAYGCYFVWKTLLKTVEVYSHTNQSSSGKYLTKELNLESVDFQGDTTELITRLFPRGKDDTTIVGATVTTEQIQQYGLVQGTHYNSSLKYITEYVECHDYTDKVICGSLSDDRFTDSTNLLAYALKQVARSAMPVRSYECSVINLAKQNPEYAFLTIQLHSTISLIDNERGINVDHRVVKYIEYPDNRARDKVTLSTVPDDITNTIEKVASSVRIDTDKIVSDMESAIKHATDLITSAQGGYLMLKDTDNDRKPDELVISDKSDPTNSTANVWRFNKNGLAHSSNGYRGNYSDFAITMDGHVVADRLATHSITSDMIATNGLIAGVITSGVLKSADGSSYFDLDSGLITSSNINVTGGTIKIGSGEYYTYIANGSIEQHAKNGNLIGGLVPVASGNIYAQALYYDPSTSDSIDFSYKNQDGNFESIMQLKSDRITAYKDFSICGQVLSDISLSGEYGIKLNDKYVLRYYKGSVAVGSDTDSLTLYGTSVTTDATISCANLLVGGKAVLTEIPSILSVSCLYASDTITIGGKPVLTGIPSNLSVDCLYASGTITVGGKPVLTDIPSMIDCTGINASNYINVGGKPVLTSLPSSIDCHSVVFDAEEREGTYSYIAGKTSETGLNVYDKKRIDIYGGASRIDLSDSGITVKGKIIPESGSTGILGSLSDKFYQVSSELMVANQYLVLKGDSYNVAIQYYNGNLSFGVASEKLYLYAQNVFTTCNVLPSSSNGASLGDSSHLFYRGYFGYDVYIGSNMLSVNNAISRLFKVVKNVAGKVGVSTDDLIGNWQAH